MRPLWFILFSDLTVHLFSLIAIVHTFSYDIFSCTNFLLFKYVNLFALDSSKNLAKTILTFECFIFISEPWLLSSEAVADVTEVIYFWSLSHIFYKLKTLTWLFICSAISILYWQYISLI